MATTTSTTMLIGGHHQHQHSHLLPLSNRIISSQLDGEDPLIPSTSSVQQSPPRWLQRIHEAHRVLTVRNRIQNTLERRKAVYNIQSHVQLRQSKYLSECERMNERSTLRDMVGEVGVALFDPLDLERLRCEISCDGTGRDYVTANTVSLHVPTFSRSTPLTTSLASFASAMEHDSIQSLDEVEEQYPVDMEPESASSLYACPRILTDSMIQQLHDEGLPDALQMNRWERCFAIGRDGDSFLTFFNRCAPYQHTLIVIKTVSGHILGGFATESWAVRGGHTKGHSYYGTGQSFLFCNHPGVLPGYDADVDPSKELTIYTWSGDNNYCQICNVDEQKLAMGGHGDFGLVLNENFYRGQTGRCRTYNNPPLTPDLAGQFEVESFEVYGLAPLFQANRSMFF